MRGEYPWERDTRGNEYRVRNTRAFTRNCYVDLFSFPRTVKTPPRVPRLLQPLTMFRPRPPSTSTSGEGPSRAPQEATESHDAIMPPAPDPSSPSAPEDSSFFSKMMADKSAASSFNRTGTDSGSAPTFPPVPDSWCVPALPRQSTPCPCATTDPRYRASASPSPPFVARHAWARRPHSADSS